MGDLTENEDEIIPYTSSKDLAEIKLYDSTVEIVGFVDSIDCTKVVGQQGHTILKFYLSNGQGDKVQIVVWNKQNARVEPLIRVNYIVHLDGGYCKPCPHSNFNGGNVSYELIVQSNTIINVLGKQNVKARDDIDNPKLVEIGKVGQYNKSIKVQCFIKSNFAIIEKQARYGKEIRCGSVTDGDWKLEIHVPVTSNSGDDDRELEFEKGDHIQATGFPQLNANPIHLLVKSMMDIEKIDSTKMALKKLLRGPKMV